MDAAEPRSFTRLLQSRIAHLPPPSPSSSSFKSSSRSSIASTSNRSLTSIFSSLDADDVRFFDELITTLRPREESFAALNTAYQNIRRTWPGLDEERDEHLYDSLLSLTKVRGRDWSEKWDAVRVGLGLEMRGGDITSAGSAIEDDIDSASDVHTLGGSSSTATTHPRHSSHWSRSVLGTDADADSQWTQETSQSEGSDADQSSQSTEEERYGKTTNRHRSSSSTVRGGDDDDDATPQRLRATSIAALQAKRDAMIRQAAHLAKQTGQSAALSPAPRPAQPQPPPPTLTRSAPTRNVQVDQLTRLLSRLQHQSPDTDSSPGSQDSESEPQQQRRQQPQPERRARIADTAATTRAAGLTATTQKRIDDMLASLRADRESLKDAVERHAQESEEATWSGTMRLADKHHHERLLHKCWSWWRHVDEVRIDHEKRADDSYATSLLLSHFHDWREDAQRSRSLSDTAERADHIRALLYGWRVWRRKHKSVKAAHWEARKDEMREGYTKVKDGRAARLQTNALRVWHQKLLDRRAVNFRNGHLLGGAFYLWKIKLDVSHELGEQYTALVDRVERRSKMTTLRRWRKMTQLQSRLVMWEESVQQNTLSSCWQTWNRNATLLPLATTYATQRLQRSTLRMWLERMAESSVRKRRQTQADRLHRRATQKRALQQWRIAREHRRQQDRAAEDFQVKRSKRLARRTLVHWKLQSRATLLVRVRHGRMQKKLLDRWRQQYVEKTVDMPRRAKKLAKRHGKRAAVVCLSFWATRTRAYIEKARTAKQVADRNLLKDIVGQWKSASQRHSQRAEEAAAYRDVALIRGAWSAMRARIQSRRLDDKVQKRCTAVMKHTLHHWRARAVQQGLDRLGVAHMESKRTLRLQRETLRHWTQRVIERRAVLIEVSETHKEKVLIGALQHWRSTLSRVRDLHRLGESFADIRTEDTKRRHLQTWLLKYRTLRSLRERSDRFIAQRSHTLQRETFTKWYDSWRESILHEAEYTTSLQRQDSLKSHSLRKWMSKTTHIPALRFHHTKLKFLALQRWRDSLPRAVVRRRAVEFDGHVLQGKAFGHWIEKAKARRAARAAARFGGPSLTRIRRHSARLGSPFVVRRRSGRLSGALEVDAEMPIREMATLSVQDTPTPREIIDHRDAHRPSSAIYTSTATPKQRPARRPMSSLATTARHDDEEVGRRRAYTDAGLDSASESAHEDATPSISATASVSSRGARDARRRPHITRSEAAPRIRTPRSASPFTSRRVETREAESTPRANSTSGAADFLEDLRKRRRQVMTSSAARRA